MIELFAGVGMVGFVLTLFKINHDMIKKNDKCIREYREEYHKLDKKLDILILTLEIKYPTAVRKAKKKNGEE